MCPVTTAHRVAFRRLCALAVLAASAAGAAPLRVLFVGNSFFYGALSAVEHYRPRSVHDLNGSGYGGVPALFRRLADEGGLDVAVALETVPGAGFDEHYDHRQAQLDGAWDVVVMSTYSTLDRDRPGDPSMLLAYTPRLTRFFAERNPAVRVYLNATWSRADQTYRPEGHWYGRAISAMAEDVRAGYEAARAADPRVRAVVPTGSAWNRAFATGLATVNPYLPAAPGQVDLWAEDHYHASEAGYYLEALVVYATVTGDDPRRFGAGEAAAVELGLSAELTVRLQRIAHDAVAGAPPP